MRTCVARARARHGARHAPPSERKSAHFDSTPTAAGALLIADIAYSTCGTARGPRRGARANTHDHRPHARTGRAQDTPDTDDPRGRKLSYRYHTGGPARARGCHQTPRAHTHTHTHTHTERTGTELHTILECKPKLTLWVTLTISLFTSGCAGVAVEISTTLKARTPYDRLDTLRGEGSPRVYPGNGGKRCSCGPCVLVRGEKTVTTAHIAWCTACASPRAAPPPHTAASCGSSRTPRVTPLSQRAPLNHPGPRTRGPSASGRPPAST